jgi:hypothetical protein
VPYSPQLVELAISLPVVLLVAYLIARLIKAMFGRHLPLSLLVMVVISVLGISIGMFLGGMFIPGAHVYGLLPLLLAFGSSIALSFLAAGIATAARRGRGDVDVMATLAAGESDRVEFKETARWNVREDKRDARMELAIAKTVAAFLNSSGGVLVIGANDAGEAVGLDRDYATLRTPDRDRFELWMRDLFSTLLGRNAAALPRIRFATAANGAEVCAVSCPPSPRPVFLSQSKDGSSTELWVRVGNSTRSFGVDEAVAYVSRHWRPNVATVLLGRPSR